MQEMTTFQKRRVFEQYLAVLDLRASELLPDGYPFPYNVCLLIEQVRWQHFIITGMVRGELRELTNILNQWMGTLMRWHAWINVMDQHNAESAWNIQLEFVEPIVFKCLFEPSAARDRFTFIATNAFHQVRCADGSGYEDHLEYDPPNAGHPKRNEKEVQLKKIMEKWKERTALLNAIKKIDDQASRKITGDFRNLSSHSIAPRLSKGYTRMVMRQVEVATELEPVGDGTLRIVEVPEKYRVSYSFGGMPPLTMHEPPRESWRLVGLS